MVILVKLFFIFVSFLKATVFFGFLLLTNWHCDELYGRTLIVVSFLSPEDSQSICLAGIPPVHHIALLQITCYLVKSDAQAKTAQLVQKHIE